MWINVPQGQMGYALLRPRAASNNLSSMEVKCWMEISRCLPYKLPVIIGVQVLCLHNGDAEILPKVFFTVRGIAKWFQGLI